MPGVSTLEASLHTLYGEFPWAQAAVDLLSERLRTARRLGIQELRLPPILLAGPPGAGKSRFCRRVAELLRLPYIPIGCGGRHDAKALSGTSRGWSTGEPSPLVRLLIQRRSASALVLLDEIDKAARNGSDAPPMTSLLLSLLESETAQRWYDSYLQTTCDMSHVTFFATANSLAGIPRPLLSRFELIYVPEPSSQHLESLITGITRDLERDWGMEHGVLPHMPATSLGNRQIDARSLKKAVLRFIGRWSEEHLAPQRLH
jgi:SpoVK/Ycf46/Vps4 family AAA+-type ATPase